MAETLDSQKNRIKTLEVHISQMDEKSKADASREEKKDEKLGEAV